jgi:ankyrin repeat protein
VNFGLSRARGSMSALMEAVVEDITGLLRALLKDGLAGQADEQTFTALMVACQDGHLDCLHAMLEARAPVAHSAQAVHNGFTALMLACGKGHVECVRELLETGASRAGRRH